MAKIYQYPGGPLIKSNGEPTPAGRAYLLAIQKLTQDINGVTNLDGGTSYSNDELRDKMIEVISALQG